ncbi:hypothetical protein BT67DRAFT_288085 [Trichocladium antarcticum]|uniref:Uncharacterized protein n=1 Tax=Trichocladium antarcticum TaxID=1450529 RepID=A0AAN6UKZ8_9PEZI|nr:hypothetical protein BT67DRAFT_288085 [Trichocladium antarcticum]
MRLQVRRDWLRSVPSREGRRPELHPSQHPHVNESRRIHRRKAKSCRAVADSASPTHRSPGVLPDTIPFAFPDRRRLRNDYKRRRRRGLEVVAHSTSFTPVESSRTPFAYSRWRYIVGARTLSPVGADKAECWRVEVSLVTSRDTDYFSRSSHKQ